MHGPKVLLVDDDPDTLGMLRLALELKGLAVTEAPDAPTAIRMLQEAVFNALVIDLAMPGMDGTTVIEALPGLLRGRNLPVFVITALCPETPRERAALEAGAVAILHKPFEPGHLIRLLIEHRVCI